MTQKGKILAFTIPVLTLLTCTTIYYFYFRKFSAYEITADNFRSVLKESKIPISDNDISPSTQSSLNFYRGYAAADQDNGTMKVVRIKYDDFLQIQHSTKTTFLKTVSNWIGPRFDQLQSCHIGDYYMANENLPSTSPQLKEIVDMIILKEGFVLKESNLKKGYDILLKETQEKFIIIQIVGSYSKDRISSISFSAFGKRK